MWSGSSSRNMTTPTPQIQALEKGEIDIALSVNSDNVAQLKGKDGVTIKNAQAAVCSFLLMNNDPAIGKEMANPKVQQAVRYAIDYEGLKKMCGEGASLPLSIVPQGFGGREDPARQLPQSGQGQGADEGSRL